MCPLSPVTIRLDAQFGTPYPRSAGFDTDIGAFIESSAVCSGKGRWLAYRSTATSASSSPARLVTLVRPRIVPHVRITMSGRGPSSNINSDLYQDHGGIIYRARGLNVNIALKRPCYFSGQRTRICHHHLLEYRFDDHFGGIVRNWVYNNPGKFCRVPMEESLAIRDIPEPCQIWMGIWMSLGRGVQLLARTSFGRSNR